MPRAADAAAGEHIVTIDAQPYPVARARDGLMWRVADQGGEVRTAWTEWAEMGEAERRSGRRYFFGEGWDSSVKGLLKLSPEYKSGDPNGRLSTGYGYLFEAYGPTDTLAYDAASTGKGNDQLLMWEHTVGSGDDRLLVVALAFVDTGGAEPPTHHVSYASQPMTRLAWEREYQNIGVELWYLVAPPSGTSYVSVYWTGGGRHTVGGATSWSGVDQANPIREVAGANGESTSPSVTVSAVSGEFVVDVVANNAAETIDVGANQTERWEQTQDTITCAGSTQDGADGGVMSWSTTPPPAAPPWAILAATITPGTTPFVFSLDTDKITKFTWDASTGPSRVAAGDENVSSGKAGRPLYANSKWYAPMGATPNARRLDAVGVGADSWADAGWKALHLSTRQEGIVQGFARAHDTNKIAICNDTGNLTSWGDDFPVGDGSTKITDLLEMLGELLVAKEDNLYRFDQAAAAEPVISWRGRAVSDPDNGRGTAGHSGMVFYPSAEGLDRYLVVEARARPMGLDTLPFFRDVEELDGPAGGRHAFVVTAGPYLYLVFNHQQSTYICQGRFREDFDPPGAEILWNSILELPICKGALVDSRKVLWLKGAALDIADRNVFTVQLGDNGSTDRCPARGQADHIHNFYFDQVIDLPRVLKQLRLFVLETENFGDPEVSSSPTSVGSTYIEDTGQSWSDDEYNDYFVLITGGTAAGELQTITDTTASPRRITVASWGTQPDITSTYVIVTKYVQAQVFRDGGASEDVGDPIGTDALTEINWTVGSNDQGRRPRMALKCVTASVYDPAAEDPSVRFAELVQRAPSIYSVIIPTSADSLQDQGPEDVRQALLRLVNQGFVDIGEPDAVGDATWEGEIEQVAFKSYVDEGGNVAGGIEVRIARYVVD